MKEIVIVGRDAPAWLAACVMQQALGPAGIAVTVIELPSRAQAADVFIALPALEALHARLGIEEPRLLSATRGAYTLGRQFTDASGKVPPFFQAHGSTGTRIDRKEFLPHWLRARRLGLELPFDVFSLTASAARQGRMLLPDAETEGLGFTDYGYHLPAIPYAAWLRHLALRRGVRTEAARSLEVRVDAQHGVRELLLDGERRVTGDFFLDVSGPEALLAQALGVAAEDWRPAFPIDRVLSAHAAPVTPLPVYTEVRAHPTGWVALAASQACVHVQQAWCSDLLVDSAALDAASGATGLGLQGAVIRDVRPARRVQAWTKNCVALGDAACVFDPLQFLDLHAVQVGLVHLVPLFPVRTEFDVERDEYNQNMRAAFERMRDFQGAHYALARYGRNGVEPASPFWERLREIPLAAELRHKIDVFRARGETVDYEDEAFTIDDWRSLLIGHGVIPESHDPAVDRTSPELLKNELQRILAFIQRKVAQQATHADYLGTLRGK